MSVARITDTNDEEFKRIYWQSRRGMLELDLVLMPFVEKHFVDLSLEQQDIYRELMLSDDQDLFAWFMQRREPEEQNLASMVKHILSCA